MTTNRARAGLAWAMVLVAFGIGAGTSIAPADAGEAPEAGDHYVLPVQAPVVDPFREPSTPWGPGNRGWEFASRSGDQVVAVGSGIVMFAGQVAGRGVVTMAHRDGLLSSLTGLETIAVTAGRSVEVGTPVGTAAPGLHLGFRRDGVYIDPSVIYGVVAHAILVPIPP